MKLLFVLNVMNILGPTSIRADFVGQRAALLGLPLGRAFKVGKLQMDGLTQFREPERGEGSNPLYQKYIQYAFALQVECAGGNGMCIVG
jgi:hypothetical protein